MTKIIRFLILLFLVTWSAAFPATTERPRNPCAAETFYHAKVDSEDIFAEYAGSVFRLEVLSSQDTAEDPTVGTAYLIDTDRGYVLTAYHVVSGADKNPQGQISGTTVALPGQKLAFKIVDHRETEDVALLQVTNRDLLKQAQIRPFEIALHFLPEGTHYATIGYPRGKDTPNKQRAEWQGKHEGDELLDIKQDVDDGSSGSPLIDQNGVVVATCVSKIGSNEALYSPLVDVDDMLAKIPTDARSDNLDRKIRSTDALAPTRQSLIQGLKWISSNIMNLELYAWANQAAKHRKDYEDARIYLECPVLEALSDRRLGDSQSVQIMASLGSPNLQANLTLDSARQDLLLGRTSRAREKASQANQSFQQLGDAQAQATALATSAQADLWQKNFHDASLQLQNAIQLDPLDPVKKIFLAQAYAGLGDLRSANDTVKDAAQALNATGNPGGEAFALKTWGEIDAAQGQYTVATQHMQRSKELFQQAGFGTGAASAQSELAEFHQKADQLPTPSSRVNFGDLIGGLAVASLGVGALIPGVRRYGVDAMRTAWHKVSRSSEH